MILEKSIKPLLLTVFPLSSLIFFTIFLMTSYVTLWGGGYEWTAWDGGMFTFGMLLSTIVTATMLGRDGLGETALKLFRWLGFLSFMFFWGSFLVIGYQTLWGIGYGWTQLQLLTLVVGLLLTGAMAWAGNDGTQITDLMNNTAIHAFKWFTTACLLFFFGSFVLMNLLALWGGGYEWNEERFFTAFFGMMGAFTGILWIKSVFEKAGR